jgi:hypothetical protein
MSFVRSFFLSSWLCAGSFFHHMIRRRWGRVSFLRIFAQKNIFFSVLSV